MANRGQVLKRFLMEIEKKNSWGKNELKELLLQIIAEYDSTSDILNISES